MNGLKPPFIIRVVNAARLAPELKDLIYDPSLAMERTRMRRLTRIGNSVAASLEIANK